MPDGIVLSEKDRAKLDGIVQKMTANKESEENIRFVVDDFKKKYGVKKKESSEPTSQKGAGVSPTKPTQPSTSLATDQPTRAQASVALGGPTKLFGQQEQARPQSVMYGDGIEQENVLIPSKPLEQKQKKYYRIVADERKDVQTAIKALEDKNLKLGRSIEEIQSDGTYQYLQKKKEQLDQEFKPAEVAIREVKKDAAFATSIIERLISSATEGKQSYLSTENIKLDKEVEDKLIDFYDDAPEETKQKWYKGGLSTETKEELINNAKIDVLNKTHKKLQEENKYFTTEIRDNPNISQEDKVIAYNRLKAKNEAFDAKVATEFAGDFLKDNFKSTTKSKNLDEAIMSRFKGFFPEQADSLSTFLEGMGQIAAKVRVAIPEMILIGGETFNQAIGTSDENDYTPIEATLDLINDTTNLNFLPSSKIEKGQLVTDKGDWNPNAYSITKTLANTLPFSLEIMRNIKKGRMEGAPQSMISQLINPKYNKGFADKLRVTETAYKATIGDNYRDAKEMGMDNAKAFTYSNVMSLAEGVVANIMPEYKYFDSLTGAALKSAFKGSLKAAATKQAAKNVTKDFFKNIAGEIGEEEVVLAIEDGLKFSLLLNHENSEFFNLKRQKELVGATVIMSGALGGANIPSKFNQNRKDIYRSVYDNIGNLQDSFNQEINSTLNDEKTKQTFRDAYKFASDISNAIAKAPETVTADQVDLLVQKNKLEEKKKNIDAAFHPDINEEIAGIDAKIREMSKAPAAQEMSVNAPVAEPTAEQQLQDVKDGNVVTFEYESKDQVPEAFKDKISSSGEINGKPYVRVTVAKSLADFQLQESSKSTKTTTAVENEEVDSEINRLDEYNKRILEDENSYAWEKELAKEYFADKKKYIEKTLEIAEKDLKENPESGFDKKSVEKAKKGLKELYEQEAKTTGSTLAVEAKPEDLLGKPTNATPTVEAEAVEVVPTTVTYNDTEYSKNEAGNWVNTKTGNEVKGIGTKGKDLINTLNDLATETEATATEEIAPSEIDTTLDEVITPASNNIKEQIARAKKAISKFLPNVEIVYHTTAESFQAVVGDNSRGYYDPATKKIHINGSNADKTTVSHEVFHAVILKYISSDKQATDLTNRMFKALAKSIKGNPKLLEDINKFAESYSKEQKSEEKLAEILGYLASEYDTLPDVSKNIIQKWIEKIAKMVGIKKFTDQEVVDFMNTIATKVAYGQEITETDVEAINQGVSTYIAEPTVINRYQKTKEERVKVGDHKLSFVKQSDIIDFDSLLKDISDKKQKVWFWVADQLGRGNYYDAVIDGEHYLDAGPSFALDPKNREKNVIWASGKNESEITKLIDRSDYIFIISGSPLKSKLFNKNILDIVAKRVGDFKTFKEDILKVSKVKPLNDVLSSVNSWEQLRESPKRKEFLLNVLEQADKKTPLKNELETRGAILDLNELRDGFYADNNFDINDIMLVLKPTKFGGKSDHSTYENNILGEVIGVPDIKVNAFDILPSEIKDKYRKDLGKSQQQQAVAPYGIGVKPIERRQKQISPENSSNYANMTEDGKGNFVFYHFGPRGINSVDPKKYGSNKGAITSKPEVAAMGRVGGMSQFYTMPEYQESNVSGDKYMIKVPMAKVYDFNTDPENFYDRAKEIFKRKHPDLPFTANDQLAHITKLAEKAGYDMTVAEWNNMSRAQSTKPLTPVDTQVMDGNTISKPFKESYESNSAKGFTAVVPVSKEAKLKEVYDNINNERNSQNRYDKLYRLREEAPKLSQDEITTMIEESDISQEMKDAYAEAVAYEPGTRMSGRRQVDAKAISKNTKAEVDRVKALPIKAEDGATFNLDGTKYDGGGLVVPMNSLEGNTTQEKLSPEMIGDFAKENEDSIGDESMVKMGIYKFPDKVDVSVDMNIVIPNEHREVALEFGALIGQRSLFDLDSFEYVETGGDGLNPMKLTAEQFREASASLKNGVMPTFVSGRRQKSPLDTAVEAGKRKGFSNKEIADYLVAKGYTRSQATNAILRYDNVVAVKLRKEDSVFTKEGRNKIVTFLDNIKRRALSAKSFLPKSVFLLKEGIEANIKAEAKRASYLVNDFNKLVKKYNGDLEVLQDEFDKYLRGDQTAVLPDEFKAVAGKMRMHIDNLSQMLVKNGVVTLSQAETIAANLGQYINRSYQVFDKKNWADQVKDEMKEAARQELRDIFKANTGKVPKTGISGFAQAFTAKVEQEAAAQGFDVDIVLEKFINEQIDSLINRESAATFLGMGKTGSKNLSIMKEKTDIPLAIRQLMGEYTDASQNYARTILKIATLAENARFLQEARNAGMGVFFFREGDLNKPAEFNVKIAGDTSETMNPLNGLYTTKEIADAFKTSISAEKFIEGFVGPNGASAIIKLYSGYMKLLSVVKWNKTIASIATHSKNITGNIWFMLSNGYFNPKKYTEAFMVLKNSKDNELREKLDEYIRAGIIDQSAALGEIKAMFSDADFETAIENRLKKNPIEKAKKASKWVITKLNTAYQLEDDFYKIVTYESEKARYSNADFSKPFDQLNEDQKLMVSAKAAENTKNVLPNYARIPGLVKILRVFPITGTFISFQAEAYRTAWNTVALAFDELSSSNKKIKAIGAKRLAGIAFSQSIKFGLMSAIGTVLRGGDDEEEDELNRNVRSFVPEWSKKSDLTLIDYGDGKFSYVDFSASDPHGGIKKAYNSFMAGDGAIESFTNGMAEILGPFVKKDMLLEAITDINNNENSYGGKLYNEADTNVNKINAVMARIYKVLEPGTMTSARKVAEAENVGNELGGQLSGYKVVTIDVGDQLGFKMKDSKQKITEGPRRLYNSAFYKFEDKKITIEELKATYDQANSEQKEIYKEIINNIKAASFFGVGDDVIDDSMDGLGKDVINDLWYGEAPDLKEKQVKLTDAEFKKKFGDKAFNLMLRGRKLMKKGAK
jgi:glutaminase